MSNDFKRQFEYIKTNYEKVLPKPEGESDMPTKDRLQLLTTIAISIDELDVYTERYTVFDEMTRKLTSIKKHVEDMKKALAKQLQKDLSLRKQKHNLSNEVVTNKCDKCTRRVAWIWVESFVRFSNGFQFTKPDMQCCRCKRKIGYTGSVGESQIFVGIHVEQLVSESMTMNDDCGPICCLCGGREFIQSAGQSKNTVIIAFRYHVTGEMQFTKYTFKNGIPSTETETCRNLTPIAADLFAFCAKMTDTRSMECLRRKSRIVPLGQVHCCLSKEDNVGQTLKMYYLELQLTRDDLTDITTLQKNTLSNPTVVKGLMITTNSMQKPTSLKWMKIVEGSDGLEDEFNIKIKHGVNWNLSKICPGSHLGHGDIAVLRHFLAIGTYSAHCQPWTLLVFGGSTNIINFLKYLVMAMNCWIGDNQNFGDADYPPPLMISSLCRWCPDKNELWEFKKIADNVRRFCQFHPHILNVFQPSNRAEMSSFVLSKKFAVPGFTVDALTTSAANILMHSVCFTVPISIQNRVEFCFHPESNVRTRADDHQHN